LQRQHETAKWDIKHKENIHKHNLYINFFSPTDAQLDILKNNFKFALKLTLKSSYMFRREKHHPQGTHYLSLAKVTTVKIS
jgi:hypothetical protein